LIVAAALTVCGLLRQGARQLAARPAQVRQPLSPHIFTTGARWLSAYLPPQAGRPGGFDAAIPFGRYGSFKYGSSLLALLVVAGILAWLHLLWWLPLAGLAFYVVEVHFLFLFPLLLDGAAHPLRASVRATYRVGFLKALIWTLTLAAFMLVGLLRWRQPWRNWHMGCLALIQWYCHEVRDRV
jgi:hypothetical protein